MVTFSDGSSYFCHENHEWTLYNRMRCEWQTIETNHFLKPTRFGKAKQTIQGRRCMYQLPVAEPLQYKGSVFLTHPYVLGAWLGDGSAGKPCITGAKSDYPIIDRIVDLGYPVSAVCEHTTTGVLTTYFSGDGVTDVCLAPKRRGPVPGRLSQELEVLGVFKDKHIPESYLRLNTELRLQLLAGLIDTDGCTDKNGRMSFTTASRKLADGVMELVAGLGFRPYIQEIEPRLSTSGIQGRKVYWRIGFQPTMSIPVTLARKRVTQFAQQRRVGLVSVERIESGKQGHCIQVDSPDGLYVVGEKLTVTHNSELGSRHFPPWVLGKHPDWEIIAASHTGSLSLSFSRYIRDLLRDPAYIAVFPDSVLDPSSQSVENWNLTGGGGYLAAGVGTGITGRGAHILLLDDLVKDQEAADSPTIRENTWEWYISTAHSRLAPGGGVLGIMTWWSEDDWAGRIQEAMKGEGEKFEIVRYPAINEEGDEYILADDRIMEIPPGSPVPEGARMTRPHGTALHPERYTTEALQRKKLNYKAAGMIRMWNALYQQNPTPDSGIYFTKDLFRRYAHAPSRRGRTIYQAWDFAITEAAQNDYTVCATIMQDEFDNLYVLDVFRFKSDDGNAIVEHMIDQYVMWDVDYLGMEDGQIWKTLRAQFEKRCQERKVYPTFEVLQPLTDKLVRANPLKGRMQLGKIYFPEDNHRPWVEVCVRELIVFPNGKHDDQVDALAWAVRMTLNHSAPRDPRPKPKGPESWKKRLERELMSVDGGHMAA
jgi:predicted phage terminase large subunit-like protein